MLSITKAIGLVGDTVEAHWLRPVGFSPVVCPRLRVAYVPRLHSPQPDRHASAEGRFPGHVHVPGFPPADEAGAGLVGCAKSEPSDADGIPPRRYGLNGLTANGRKRLQAGCSLLEEDRRLLSFWTITLPPEALQLLMELDSWHLFQDHIRRELQRQLHRKGAPTRVLAVAELHPHRSEREGQLLPHLHVLFQGKRRRGEDWVLSRYQLDNIIRYALGRVGIYGVNILAAGRIESLRRSVRYYMAKYISKATRQVSIGQDPGMLGDPRLCPRQWWFMSKALLAEIISATRRLPPQFLVWLLNRARPNEPGQLYGTQRALITDPAAPACWIVRFRSPDALFLCWEAFERALCFGPEPSPPSSPHGCA